MSKRKVIVYNTQGRQKREVTFSGDHWEDLQAALSKAGILYEGMKAIIGENQVTLESPKAVLPTGITVGDKLTNNFTLFLTPVKTKSGIIDDVKSATRRELIEEIKELRAEDEKAETYFKNYSRMDTAQMKRKLKRYYKNTEPTSISTEVEDNPIRKAIRNLQHCTEILVSIIDELREVEDVDEEAKMLEELKAKAEEIEANLQNV